MAPTDVAAASPLPPADAPRHARSLAALRRIAWDVERDLIRSRRPDTARRFVPDALSRVNELPFLNGRQARALSQLQACTYAHCAVRVERCVTAVMLRASEAHWCGDATVLQAQLRVADDALKHQTLFRRLALMTEQGLLGDYQFIAPVDGLSHTALGRGHWAALALVLALVLSAQAHYRHSLDAADSLCPLWHDVFFFHWKEASQHAVLIELAWREAHERGDAAQREAAVAELAAVFDELAVGVERQAAADAQFVRRRVAPNLPAEAMQSLHGLLEQTYRHQFIGSGLTEPRFIHTLQALTTAAQRQQLSNHINAWTPQHGT
jgi:hypothetical protein